MGLFVKFWGTRGSIPTPASWTRVYGGNTSCVEIRYDNTVFICDAGSGIRELGKDLLTRAPRPNDLHLFITHTHWDHIQGFPFFTPAYLKSSRIHVYGGGDENPFQLLSGQMSSKYFPVSFNDLGATIVPDKLNGEPRDIAGSKVRSFVLNHPGGSSGYIFERNGRKIVYATDHELPIQPTDTFPDLHHTGPLRSAPDALIEAVSGADLLIMDAQYDESEYAARKGWGHSSCFSVTDFAIQAKVRNLALFHHDPECSDAQVDAKVKSCQERTLKRRHSEVTIFAAREGMELKF